MDPVRVKLLDLKLQKDVVREESPQLVVAKIVILQEEQALMADPVRVLASPPQPFHPRRAGFGIDLVLVVLGVPGARAILGVGGMNINNLNIGDSATSAGTTLPMASSVGGGWGAKRSGFSGATGVPGFGSPASGSCPKTSSCAAGLDGRPAERLADVASGEH